MQNKTVSVLSPRLLYWSTPEEATMTRLNIALGLLIACESLMMAALIAAAL